MAKMIRRLLPNYFPALLRLSECAVIPTNKPSDANDATSEDRQLVEVDEVEGGKFIRNYSTLDVISSIFRPFETVL